MSGTRISEHNSHDISTLLRHLLERSESGKLRAFAFSAKDGPKRHVIGFAGDYWHDPVEALGCITRLAYKANQLISANEGSPETTSMPL